MATQPTSTPTKEYTVDDELPDVIDPDQPDPLYAVTVRVSGFLIDIPEPK